MARIGIVGGGVIGCATAVWLIADGHDVTVFESDLNGLPASAGNAALIALPEIAPIASPGILTSVPKWLLDPLGPLTVRWPDVPALTPWLLAFLASATPSHGVKTRKALTGLMQTALADHHALGKKANLTSHLRQTGYLSIHDTDRGVDAALAEADGVKAILGYDFERLSTAAARTLVPQLEGQFAGAVHQPGYWMVSDPLLVLRHLQQQVRERGTLVTEKVEVVSSSANMVIVTTHAKTAHNFDKIVVSAGVWSRDLVRSMGLKILLETERGYNTTYSDLQWNLSMPVGFGDHGFIASPLVNGLRIGGAVELARPHTPPNFARAKAMRTKTRRYIPSLPEGGTEWMGRRPSTPDSMPVISRHPTDSRIVFAFGHGHLGLTLSAVTARHVTELLSDIPISATVKPFDIARFQ